mmetsp:Transcript_21129/g.64360  ORF Transcript_21129/g.64360 Transcript_21129/m.64360 type:complete len:146 (-) Transcript_21129:357-794(-)|eukprot:CAMPEP_0118852142 /NCGR_PEP_ID=MMETSP1163-20130328/1286_1 /TAXON_ID=124430 /ORGANISM="Phaeomonas parva, Strain CCMP2877" /LENGTH=145 /DNA_ID=CAMNT_0006784549 /DNA_START=139 /DNA_END=576 /DNA_ORIENTATION=+
MMLFRQVIAALALAALAGAFAPPARTARLGGRSGIAAKKDAEPEGEDKRGISGQGLFELMSMGAGLPALGKLTAVNFDKPGRPDLEFELEANNFMKETDAPYFDEGWVDDGSEDSDTGPGFLENLLSGGEKQREWERKKGMRGKQ